MTEYAVKHIYQGNTIDLTSAVDSFEVDIKVNEPRTASLSLLVDEIQYPIVEGSTIEIYAQHENNPLKKIFYGYVKTYSKGTSDGMPVLDITLTDVCENFDVLTVNKRYSDQPASTIVLDLVQPLVQSGKITTTNVQSNSTQLRISFINKTLEEALDEVCSRTGWYWYVDTNRDLHFFSAGVDRGTLTEGDLDSRSYKKDTSNIVNKVLVLGKQYIYPDTGDLCETLQGTYGTWTASGSLSLADKSASLQPQAGSYSVRSSTPGANSQYLQFQFAGTLDLSQPWSHKKLNLSIGNVFKNGYLTQVSIYLMKDASNYFSSGNLVANFDAYSSAWTQLSLEVGPTSTLWNQTGTLTWADINIVRIQVWYNAALTAELYVDKMCFSEGRIYATSQDTTSQALYGVREMPAVVKDSLRTVEECQQLANAIIENNKNPKDILENIVTSVIHEEYEVGDKISISVPETTISNVKIVGLKHVLDEGDLYTELEISSTTKTASEVVKEHEERLGEHESESLTPSVTVSGPSSRPVEPTVVLDNPVGPPAAPTGLTLQSKPLSIFLKWNANTEADLDRYKVYRGTISTQLSTIALADTNQYTDFDVQLNTTYYYRVSAVDRVGNESTLSSLVSGTASPVDVNYVTQPPFPAPLFTVTAYQQEIDTASEFKTWFKIEITRVDNAGGYYVKYSKTTVNQWNQMFIPQPTSGNAIAYTPLLEIGDYYLQACAVTKLGQEGTWANTFTFVDKDGNTHYNASVATTCSNDVAPSAPGSVSAIPALDALLIQCSEISATDFAYYEFYVGTSLPPSTLVGTSTRPYFLWNATSYDPFYVGVKAVDTAGNKSTLTSSSTTYTPVRVKPIDLSIESRPWTSNLKIFEDCISRGKFYYGSSGFVESWKRYVRTDTTTVGSNTYNNFGLVNSDASSYVYVACVSEESYYTVYFGIRIFKVASDGTETEITSGSPVAIVSRTSGSGVQTADYSFPGVTLATTDRLCIKYYIDAGEGWVEKLKVTTEPLGVTSLPAGTWRVSYYTSRSTSYYPGQPPMFLTYGYLYFGSTYDTSIVTVQNGSIKFADGTTKTINGDLTGTKLSSNAVGAHFVYWQDADSDLHITTDYATAVGEGKGLIATIDRKTDRPSTILMFDSYTPTIGAGCIAAKSILADHIKAGQINTSHITSDTSLAIKASQILLSGTTWLSSWSHSSDTTKIDGGKIYTGSVTTSQIQLNNQSTPPSSPRTLWYWGDKDLLCFQGEIGQVGYIKRTPITELNTPPENMVLNPCFEEDINADDIPDYWTPPSGSQNVDWGSSTLALKGKRCVWSKISTSGTYKEWQSISVPVRPSQVLYARCFAKADVAYTPNIGIIHIAWYAPDGTTQLGEQTSSVKALGTTWDVYELVGTVPADGTYSQNVRYARVHLYAGTIATRTTYFDDVSLSEIRAGDLVSNAITTRHIKFDVLNQDPTYEAGKMWYRGDLDELRFASGTTYDKVMQIPKVPLGAPLRQLFWLRSSWLPANCEFVGTTGSGYPVWDSARLELSTGTTSGSICLLRKEWYFGWTWAKRRIVSIYFSVFDITYFRLRIWSGFNYQLSGGPSFGVYLDNNSASTSATLYGFSWNGTNLTTISLGTVNAHSRYLLTIEFNPDQNIKFYLNGTLVGTITTNLPSGTANADGALNVEVYNYTAANRYVAVAQVACVQEL